MGRVYALGAGAARAGAVPSSRCPVPGARTVIGIRRPEAVVRSLVLGRGGEIPPTADSQELTAN